MAVKISPNSKSFPFSEEHSDSSYKYAKSSRSPPSNARHTNRNHGPADGNNSTERWNNLAIEGTYLKEGGEGD